MRRSPNRGSALTLLAVLSMLAVAAVGCSKSTTVTVPNGSMPPAAINPNPSTAAGGGMTGALSGKWTGKYSGTYQGTFVLVWHESGSTLSGTINLSSVGGAMAINGTVSGDTIQFGTVGSTAITYTGKVSGNSMSGTYQVGNGTGSGSWSANKA